MASRSPEKISILIPAHNRADCLARVLASLKTLTLPMPLEVIVVDDFSLGRDVERLCASHPGIIYARTPSNLGVVGARNFGLGRANGDIIVHLDDDSYFRASNALTKIIEAFNHDQSVGVVACNIETLDARLLWPRDAKPFHVHRYSGGACAWRRAVVDQVGGYHYGFWRQGEEVEHSMRLIEAGFRILAVPEILVLHEASSINRDPVAHRTYEVAAHMKRTVLRVPLVAWPIYLFRWLVLLFVTYRGSIRWRLLLSEFQDERRGLGALLRSRKAISLKALTVIARARRTEKAVLAGA